MLRSSSYNNTSMQDNDEYPHHAVALTLPRMLNASPQHHGLVQKLHIPFFYSWLPRFLQRLISSVGFLSFLAPKWKRRYLILLGSYLYKFSDNTDDSGASKKNDRVVSHSENFPKGSPIPVESIDINTMSAYEVPFCPIPPGGKNCTFALAEGFGKIRFYAAESPEQAATWLNSLREARRESITRSMGHAPVDSFPTSWIYFDNLGRSLCERKERIRSKVERSNLREIEMSSIVEGGPVPRGYFG